MQKLLRIQCIYSPVRPKRGYLAYDSFKIWIKLKSALHVYMLLCFVPFHPQRVGWRVVYWRGSCVKIRTMDINIVTILLFYFNLHDYLYNQIIRIFIIIIIIIIIIFCSCLTERIFGRPRGGGGGGGVVILNNKAPVWITNDIIHCSLPSNYQTCKKWDMTVSSSMEMCSFMH